MYTFSQGMSAVPYLDVNSYITVKFPNNKTKPQNES